MQEFWAENLWWKPLDTKSGSFGHITIARSTGPSHLPGGWIVCEIWEEEVVEERVYLFRYTEDSFRCALASMEAERRAWADYLTR